MITAQEESLLETIEAYRIRWENTRNPLFVWKAIDLCFMIAVVRVKAATGHLPTFLLTESHPFPAWCLGYLSLAAARLSTLAEGKDYRIAPAPFGDADPADTTAWARAADASSDVNPVDAANLSTWALGLRRQGATAFGDIKSLEEKQMDMLSFEEFTLMGGMSYEAAMEALAEDSGLEPRGLAKRLAAVKEAENGSPRKK